MTTPNEELHDFLTIRHVDHAMGGYFQDFERVLGEFIAARGKAARIAALEDVKKLIASVEYMNDRLHSEQSPNDAKRVGAARAIKLLRELIEKERPA
jgi:hypothetical protein